MKNFITKYVFTLISFLILTLTGCQSAHQSTLQSDKVSSASGSSLGTQWGDGIESHVQSVSLERVSSNPTDIITIEYSAHPYKGKAISEIMLNQGQIGMAILDDHNHKLSLIKQQNSGVKLQGNIGQSYQLYYHNYSNKTFEVIATVDGLDVINGKAGSLSNNGYILNPYDTLLIKGFRKSNSEVASFTFSNSANAYANHTDEGSPNNIGVIGTAIFQLKDNSFHRQQIKPNAFPADNTNNSYAKPPTY